MTKEKTPRGAYLVQGPAHCGACHSPRNFMMAQDGVSKENPSFLTGGDLNDWSVPGLRGKNSWAASVWKN